MQCTQQYAVIVKMGTTYSSHYTGDYNGLEPNDVRRIVYSAQYRMLDKYERQFFSRMIEQGELYTRIMSREEIVQEILNNINAYLTDGELVLAWFTDDRIYPDVGLLRSRPITRVILRTDQEYLLNEIEDTRYLQDIIYVDSEQI